MTRRDAREALPLVVGKVGGGMPHTAIRPGAAYRAPAGKAERVLALLAITALEGPRTVEELRVRLDVGDRLLRRLLDAVQAVGFQVSVTGPWPRSTVWIGISASYPSAEDLDRLDELSAKVVELERRLLAEAHANRTLREQLQVARRGRSP